MRPLMCRRPFILFVLALFASLSSPRFLRFLFFASLSLLPTRRLCMMFNHISGTLPKAWSRMTRMRTLDLMMNRYTLPLYRSTTLPFYHSLLPFYCGTQSILVPILCSQGTPHTCITIPFFQSIFCRSNLKRSFPFLPFNTASEELCRPSSA